MTDLPALTVAEALALLLDQVDYLDGNCGITEPVGGVLSRDVIAICRAALAREKSHAEN
jgi:hypothetical protein